jgi:hypothetical protein
MKNIRDLLILAIMISSLGCQQSYMMKKEDESLSYLQEEKGLLYRASQQAEQTKYNYLQEKYTFTINALYYNALKIDPYPWQNFERINISITNIYSIQTPVIDSFLKGTLFAASSALIIHQAYKGRDIRLPPAFD